jgi:hypothetical protein
MPVEAPGNDSFTTLLLHFDAANGSTTFKDFSSSNHSFVIDTGSPAIGTRLFKFGDSALNLGTVAGSLIRTANSSDFDFGSGNFTVDFWTEPGASGGGNSVINDLSLINGFTLGCNSTTAFFQAFSASSAIASYTATVAISGGALNHLAYVRNGTTFLIFLNGTSLSLTATVPIGSNTIPASGQPLFVGSQFVPPRTLDEVRISKGIARWTANFTPNPCSYG